MSIKTLAAAFAFLGIAALSANAMPQHHDNTKVVATAAAPARTIEIDHVVLAAAVMPDTTTTTTTTEPEPPPPVEQPQKKQQAAAAPPPTTAAPAAEPEPPPPAPTGSGSPEDAIAEYFGDVYQSAINVAQCESGMNPGAISSGGGNWGLFQINTVHRADFENYTGQSWSSGALNAHYNAMYARKLYDGNGGWGPWTCRWAA